MNSRLYLSALILTSSFSIFSSFAQELIPFNVRIGPEKVRGYQPCEPSIAINPTNSDNIVAGSILDNVYVSNDGGLSWSHTKLTSSHGVFGDPCVIASNTGDFYYFHLSDPDNAGWRSEKLLDRIVCQHSSDGGQTWSDGGAMGLFHPKDQDKEWGVVSQDGTTIHACWTQFDTYNSKSPKDSTTILCSFSERGGEKWSEPIRISEKAGNCLDSDETTEGAVPSIGHDGTVYVAWALNETIYFDRSTDGGKTWLEKDIAATSIVGGWDQNVEAIGRVNGMPVTAVDHCKDSPTYGRIYINWTDARNGDDDLDVFICYSDDGGLSWSEAQRINDDVPGSQQFFTWMACDPTNGSLHVVFYDRRNYSDTRTDVYVASSFDGSATWTNRRISDTPFIPSGQVFFGDYNNISAYGGKVRPIWTREDSNVLSVWTAILNF